MRKRIAANTTPPPANILKPRLRISLLTGVVFGVLMSDWHSMPQRTSKLTDRRALTIGKPKTPRHESQAQMAVRCRVGAGVAPGAPHRPVREVFPHTVRQHPP